MRFLFLHHNHPAQFVNLTSYLREAGHDVVFISETASGKPSKGTKLILLGEKQYEADNTVNQSFKRSGRFRKALKSLKEEGFVPDIVVSHSGWSCGLHVKEIFPSTKLVQYVEWWYDPDGINRMFNEYPTRHLESLSDEEKRGYVRMNVPLAAELVYADRLVTATEWQRGWLPDVLKRHTMVCHEGIDTGFYRDNRKWSRQRNLVVFATRGLEPIRGFPDVVEAIGDMHRGNSDLRFLLVGEDKCFYRKSKVYKQKCREWAKNVLKDAGVPSGVVRFSDFVDRVTYARLLKSCGLYLYMSRSFIPSWGLFNALSSGTPVLAPNSDMYRSVKKEFGIDVELIESMDQVSISKGVQEAIEKGINEEKRENNSNIMRRDLDLGICVKRFMSRVIDS